MTENKHRQEKRHVVLSSPECNAAKMMRRLAKGKAGGHTFLCGWFSQMAMWRELCDQRSNKPVDMLHRLSWEGVVAIATTPQALQVNGGKLWFAGCN